MAIGLIFERMTLSGDGRTGTSRSLNLQVEGSIVDSPQSASIEGSRRNQLQARLANDEASTPDSKE